MTSCFASPTVNPASLIAAHRAASVAGPLYPFKRNVCLFGEKASSAAPVEFLMTRFPPRLTRAGETNGVTAQATVISTSHVERQNLTLRMQSRRYTRLTNAFSKKVENHWHALSLHFWHYNWSRKHQTLKTTPAVASGIANRRMQMVELVEHLEAREAATGGRVTDYLPSPSADSK